jgi:hypothetical protein
MPQDAPSRSPSPVPFSIVDLSTYWPVHRLPVNIPPQELVHTEIASNDSHGICTASESSRGVLNQYRIPSHYLDALCILSAKITWLQMSCKVLSKGIKQRKGDDISLNILDGLRRSLTFSVTLRKLFYVEAENAYSPEMKSFTPDFRCEKLDSWLYVEFHAVTHHPPRYTEYSEMKYAEKPPLDISVQGWSYLQYPFENEHD